MVAQGLVQVQVVLAVLVVVQVQVVVQGLEQQGQVDSEQGLFYGDDDGD
jgi:hypothetical protein